LIGVIIIGISVTLALLASLLAQYAYPPRERQALAAFYGRLSLSVAKRLNAGDRNSGIFAWFVLMALVLVPVGALTWLAGAVHGGVLWLLEVAVLYASLRFLPTLRRLSEIEKALRAGEIGAAANLLSHWQAVAVEANDADSIAKLAAEHALREAHQGAFAPLFWYLVLPGPLGLFAYPLAPRAAGSTWPHPTPSRTPASTHSRRRRASKAASAISAGSPRVHSTSSIGSRSASPHSPSPWSAISRTRFSAGDPRRRNGYAPRRASCSRAVRARWACAWAIR
jgi:hypothetical protein